MKIAEISKILRKEKKVSQVQLAKALNVSNSCIAMIETGKNEPTANTLLRYADYFEVSTDYLLGRTDDLGNVTVKQTGAGLTGEEERLLRCFRNLSQADRAQATEYLTFLMEKQNKK